MLPGAARAVDEAVEVAVDPLDLVAVEEREGGASYERLLFRVVDGGGATGSGDGGSGLSLEPVAGRAAAAAGGSGGAAGTFEWVDEPAFFGGGVLVPRPCGGLCQREILPGAHALAPPQRSVVQHGGAEGSPLSLSL